MIREPHTTTITRRLALAALGAGAFTLVTRSGAFGQEATPAATGSGDEHAILGAWLLDYDEAPGNPWIATFNTDGVYVEYQSIPGHGLGLGLWLATGPRAVQVASNSQGLAREPDDDHLRDMFAVDYVPQPHAFDPTIVSFRQSFDIRAAGTTLIATGTMEVRDGDGQIIAGPFSTDRLVGTRLVPAS